MPELSKTAKASMGKQYKEVHVETTEEAIHAIRVNRDGGLHIGDMSRVDKLLEAFDKILFANGELTNALNDATSKQLTLEKELYDLQNTLKLSDVWNAGKQQVIDDAVDSAAKELMAAIPAQEEDPEHMKDFEK